MIKAIIFDFGNVFINLDIEGANKNATKILDIEALPNDLLEVFEQYEKGLIKTDAFTSYITNKYDHVSEKAFIDVWNFMLKDFPKYRLAFLKTLKLSSKTKLILLSNTNELHINWIKKHVSFYEDFKNCFDAFYLSYKINLVKPNLDIFKFVLNENNLKAGECLFVDDNQDNINGAQSLGIKTWYIDPKTQDVINLYDTKSDLF